MHDGSEMGLWTAAHALLLGVAFQSPCWAYAHAVEQRGWSTLAVSCQARHPSTTVAPALLRTFGASPSTSTCVVVIVLKGEAGHATEMLARLRQPTAAFGHGSGCGRGLWAVHSAGAADFLAVEFLGGGADSGFGVRARVPSRAGA
jgi:hypothetical protein